MTGRIRRARVCRPRSDEEATEGQSECLDAWAADMPEDPDRGPGLCTGEDHLPFRFGPGPGDKSSRHMN